MNKIQNENNVSFLIEKKKHKIEKFNTTETKKYNKLKN